jgi:ribosomal-protein-alanine N-acetyltransferase
MRFPDLRTHRLDLVETRPAHADALFAIYSDPSVTRLYPKEPCETLAECRRVLASMASVDHQRGWRWTLVRRAEGRIVGTVGYHDWDRRRRLAKVSYELVPEARGQGLAGEAVVEVLRYGFQDLGLERVLAEIHPDNEPSRRLATRLGFEETDVTRRFWRGRMLRYLVFERSRNGHPAAAPASIPAPE